ncbi:VanZ family protein [Streptomyces sp. H39-S7]|uniref:VanZ family protein n=1 Tax=Streptomyces sp. H39-S7 TaxID=3004357 RepID=UPI0022AEBFC5|nr:VanZ family protein [Streptomyces sp. H39-S7]MCZ4120228.1 VanZ family protein [Streptomyces sp. H39-S7]
MRPWPYAAFGFSLTAVACLTLWPSRGGHLAQCTVNRDLAEPFLTEQGLLNLAMFVPIGVFGVLATRQPLAVALGAPLLSVTIEVLQASVPFIARGCDSGDLVTNTTGALVGVLVTCLALVAAHAPVHPMAYRAAVTWRSAGSVAVANGIILVAFVHMAVVDSTSLQFATPDKSAAAERAVHNAFGDHYRTGAAQYMKGTQGMPGVVFITLDRGSATLSWPDQRDFQVSLAPDGVDGAAFFPVPGVANTPRNTQDAETIATTYATNRYAWGLTGSQAHAEPVGPNAEGGWFVSWRRTRDGVLMPMRLDVLVDRTGRIREVHAIHIDDPQNLPPTTISRQQAVTAALAASPHTPDAHVAGMVLLAVERHGHWAPTWLTAVQSTNSPPQATRLYVDATTGKTEPADPSAPNPTTTATTGTLTTTPNQ